MVTGAANGPAAFTPACRSAARAAGPNARRSAYASGITGGSEPSGFRDLGRQKKRGGRTRDVPLCGVQSACSRFFLKFLFFFVVFFARSRRDRHAPDKRREASYIEMVTAKQLTNNLTNIVSKPHE